VCAHPFQAREALPILVALCSQRGADNDMRAVCLRCIAALSVHSDLQGEILAEGAIPLLCRLAKLRGLLLQVPVAAALANLCSHAGLLSGAGDVADCFAALDTLSQSSNREVQVWPSRFEVRCIGSETFGGVLVQFCGL
jgi:hypothetical protein